MTWSEWIGLGLIHSHSIVSIRNCESDIADKFGDVCESLEADVLRLIGHHVIIRMIAA